MEKVILNTAGFFVNFIISNRSNAAINIKSNRHNIKP